jgi:hypothetical protein
VRWRPTWLDPLWAVAVQIVWSSRRGSRSIEHVASAHDESERRPSRLPSQRLVQGQGELGLGHWFDRNS